MHLLGRLCLERLGDLNRGNFEPFIAKFGIGANEMKRPNMVAAYRTSVWLVTLITWQYIHGIQLRLYGSIA